MAPKKKKRKSTTKRATSPRKRSHSRRPRLNNKLILLLALLVAVLLGILLDWPSSVLRLIVAVPQGPASPDRRSAYEPFPPPQKSETEGGAVPADFVGSEVCAECHRREYDLWRRSTHGRAGGTPDTETVIADFDGKPLTFRDATVRPVIRKGEYGFMVESKGQPATFLRVDAIIGGGHMVGGGTQSYFSNFPDGTLRFLPFDFSRHKGLWFTQLRRNNEWVPVAPSVALDDLLQWPPARILGTHINFTNCQNCHASQVRIRFDRERKRYVTRYTSLAINCESCHGPGRRHVQLARTGAMSQRSEIGMRPLSTLSKDESLRLCFQCHAIKDAVQPDYLPGRELERYFSLKLPILAENPYFPDGRVRAFAYQQNHLFSDCYLNGSMVCVDCHDPHSQGYRDVNGRPLPDRFDNGQCVGCHASKSENPEAHSHHSPDSPGNLCTSCHMPYLQHQGIGRRIPFARSDHTIPIPRPRFDAQLGIEGACIQCHTDKTAESLQQKTEEWYGQIKPHKPLVRALLGAGNLADRRTAARLLLADSTRHPLAQFAALSYFVKTFLAPDMPFLETEIVTGLKALSEQEDLDLKALALMSLHLARDSDPDVHSYLVSQLKSLGKDELAVRGRWAIAMDFLGYLYATRGDLDRAIVCHRKALEIKPGDAVALTNLGIAYGRKGELQNAVAALEQAVASDAVYVNAYKHLASAYLQMGEAEKALKVLQLAVQVNPVDASLHFLIGRIYRTRGETDLAIEAFTQGLRYAPFDSGARTILLELQE